jgi:hypothetical protein
MEPTPLIVVNPVGHTPNDVPCEDHCVAVTGDASPKGLTLQRIKFQNNRFDIRSMLSHPRLPVYHP